MKRPKPLVIVGVTILLGLLGWLVNQVGEVGVRRGTGSDRVLTIQNPLLPGVPFSASWQVDPDETDRSVLLTLRLASGQYEIGAGRLVNRATNAQIPCEVEAGEGMLVLSELLRGKVLAQTSATVLPAGPDCL